MNTPNSTIADLSHEIDRLRKISNLLLSIAVESEKFIASSPEYSDYGSKEAESLLGNIRYAIDEANHG